MTTTGMLITGANGFFGCHLIKELQSRGIEKLTCIVRAEDRHRAHQRLQAASQAHQLDLAIDTIEVIAADLSETDFGLGEREFRQLMAGIDSVVHTGACVNFTATADQMLRTNVEATTTLLDLARSANVRRFVHISSLAVVNGLSWPTAKPVPEVPIEDEPNQAISHYGRSKLGAERCCFEAAAKGLDVTVLRLPYLLASTSRLAINYHGYLDVVLRAVLHLEASFDDEFSLHHLPVDRCADWVATVTLAPSVPPVMHVVQPLSLPWRAWLDAAKAMGQPMALAPMEDWYKRLRQAAMVSHSSGLLEAIAFLRLEPTHKRWMHMNAHDLQFENQQLSTLVPEAENHLTLPETYLQGVIRQLCKN
ncbi:SDR family oxidoreductase [Cyanobium sp. HWJ4-Hawea]|uniref:SDR family oxidoreductase n=1 Tax=Cyanobium sp. HWJ4-Hawea TaxID=2823713 RepID=UPI0020CB6C8A|nr:SDR family oxidoreductase [Cyanobium sp. HWJ4-Hawea]MCP9808961.1 SDR family oxidoreductase [Cyanobium sp. HWJ4-Hawea]